mmetsp:Transcript_3422/g.4797  ORF Transcript_3422/g.4797 Transcript_3422/m.4797 type:complete len:189 (+) Transcript_3422:432-998(+)
METEAARLLRSGDELVAILPPSSQDSEYGHKDVLEIPGAALIGIDTTPTDFKQITETLRVAPRPLALVFRRKRLSARLDSIEKDTVPRPSLSMVSSDNDEDDENFFVDELKELFSNPESKFFCLHHDQDTKYDTLTFASMRAVWHQVRLNSNSKLFLSDAWRPISKLPIFFTSRLDLKEDDEGDHTAS